jgi:endo-1,4-beta-xylanase
MVIGPAVIAAALAGSSFAQEAATAVPAENVAREPAAATKLQSAYKDHFLIGVAINRSIATGAGGRRGEELVAKDIALVKEQFNQIAPENDLKWQLIHPRAGADGYDFGPADAFVEFGQKHNMHIIGHTLVWHSQTPNWVFAGTSPPPAGGGTPPAANDGPPAADAGVPGRSGLPGGPRGGGGGFGGGFGRGFTGPRATREELFERMREHIHTVVGRYKGKIKAWDVVNEALSDEGEEVLRNSLWLQIIGPDYIAKAFEYAHEADPDAILRYNDYGLENPAKRQKLIKLVKSLLEQKVPIHAIGSQAHVNVSTTFESMDQSLTEIASLGLPIHITELDVNTAARGQRGTGADIGANADATRGGQVSGADKRLADTYAGIFRAFVKHRENVKMVTFWGANDAVSWRRFGTPLLFDGNNQPKPAFDAVIRVANELQSKTD